MNYIPTGNHHRRAQWLLTACILAVAPIWSLAEPAKRDYPESSLTRQVDELFAEWSRPGRPGAAVGIVKDGRLIYARGYGMANLEYDIPITSRSVFRTGSIGKQFTAMCVALLAQRGKLSLDDDIRRYLPEMPQYDAPITIRHLIHHTSGLRDYLVLMGLAGRVGDYFITPTQALELLARQQGLNFSPGEQYLYSNSGYFLLGEVVARVSGMSLAEFARKNLFDPLGMHDTHIHDDRNRIVRNRATGYRRLASDDFRISITQLEIVGDGSVFTTVEDFLKWDQNYVSNKLDTGKGSLLEMVLTTGRLNDGSDMGYAFGLTIDTYRGLKRIHHGGSYMGYIANYARFPDQGFSVYVFANVSAMKPGHLTLAIADLFLEDEFTSKAVVQQAQNWQGVKKTLPMGITLPESRLREITGSYYSEELDVVAELTLEDGRLIMRLELTRDTLVPISDTRFVTTYANDDAYELNTRELEFYTDRDDRATGFLMHADPVSDIRFVKHER